MKNDKYWTERFKALEKAQERSDTELLKEIEKMYSHAKKDIESEISRWYVKFANNNNISMTEAKKLLKSDELQEFKWTIEEYIKHGEQNIDGRFEQQLINASSKVHISRYESLLTELRCVVESLSDKQKNMLSEHLQDAYTEVYYHSAYEIQKGTGVGVTLGDIDKRSLEALIKKPWAADGNNFSDRIWKDKNSLLSEINTQLTRNIALGRGPDEAIKAIAKRFETSKYNAGRLVMTESAAISAKAQKQCFEDLDVEEFQIVETLSVHTCEFCGQMDGKHFPMSEHQIGVTVPPFHPQCHGTARPYFEDMDEYGERIARDLDGKTFYVPANTTYEQWKQMQDEKYGEGSVDKARKMAYNEKADKEQYEKYKKVLGKNAPKKFADFQKIKYFDEEKYTEIKNIYKNNKNYLQSQLPYIYNGEKLFIPNNAIIQSPKTIAGKGSKTALRVEDKLIELYGGENGAWKKRVGKVESDKYIFDVHWYELNGKQYEMKLKHRSDKKI